MLTLGMPPDIRRMRLLEAQEARMSLTRPLEAPPMNDPTIPMPEAEMSDDRQPGCEPPDALGIAPPHPPYVPEGDPPGTGGIIGVHTVHQMVMALALRLEASERRTENAMKCINNLLGAVEAMQADMKAEKDARLKAAMDPPVGRDGPEQDPAVMQADLERAHATIEKLFAQREAEHAMIDRIVGAYARNRQG